MTTGTVRTYDEITDGENLAVSWPGSSRVERWVWRDGRMFQHGSDRGVDPFFFAGLMAQDRIAYGDFAPPQVGEWFGYRNGRRPYYHFYVAGVTDAKVEFVYFSRGSFAGWHGVDQANVFDDYSRLTEVPAITPQMFQELADNARANKDSAEQQRQQSRNMRDAMQSVRYAQDYINQAINYAERRTT